MYKQCSSRDDGNVGLNVNDNLDGEISTERSPSGIRSSTKKGAKVSLYCTTSQSHLTMMMPREQN